MVWIFPKKQDVPDERRGVKQQPIVSHKPSGETEGCRVDEEIKKKEADLGDKISQKEKKNKGDKRCLNKD